MIFDEKEVVLLRICELSNDNLEVVKDWCMGTRHGPGIKLPEGTIAEVGEYIIKHTSGYMVVAPDCYHAVV